MKGECEGRELTSGVPVRAGAGVVPEHNREGSSGRMDIGVKSDNQDSGTRSFQVPGVMGGTQGNGTRGYSMADLTKVDGAASPFPLHVPGVKDSVLPSYRMPPFREDFHGIAASHLAEATIHGWNKSRTAGTFGIPVFKGESQEHLGALDLTRVSHDTTSGNLQGSGVTDASQSSGVKAPAVARQKGECLSNTKGMHSQGIVAGSSSLVSTKREPPKNASERNCLSASKRLHDGSGLKPLEAVINRLKQDPCAVVSTTSIVDSKIFTEKNSMALPDVATVKRSNQDGGPGIAGVTEAKRLKQDNPTETTAVTPVLRESQSYIKEAVNGACVKNLNQPGPTSTEGVQTLEKQELNSISTKADVKTNQDITGTESMQMGTTVTEKQKSAIGSREVMEVKECLEGNTSESATLPVRQEQRNAKEERPSSVIRDKDDKEVKEHSDGGTLKPPAVSPVMQDGSSNTTPLTVPHVETMSKLQPTESPPLTDEGKETPETKEGTLETAVGPCIKSETPDTPAKNSDTAIKEGEQSKDVDEGKPPVPKEESEEGKEKNQENSAQKDGEGVAKESVRDSGEVKASAVDPSKTPRVKPEMVSTETQCDGSGMGLNALAEDDYSFVGEDIGVPGECLGACEPGKKPHKCIQCDTSFRTPYELSRHARVHNGERPYQCRLCHRCFKRKDHVEVHTRRHMDDRRHICGLCGICFFTSSCLLRHQRRTHQEAFGGKRTNELELGEVVEETGDPKGEGRDLPVSRGDSSKNGRRNKKNKPDTTYRPGGKTVCIIKKRNLRQRSYSFVELEDDVECFESDEEDRIPFLKVQEQRQEEEREEMSGQTGPLDHGLFPGSLFSSEASLGHLLLLGEVSRLLSHSMMPGALESPDSQPNIEPEAGLPSGPETRENGAESDDSDCDLPLVACDVTFMEGEGEVACLSQPDDNPASPISQEEGTLHSEGERTAYQGETCQGTFGAKETHGTINSSCEERLAKLHSSPPSSTPPISGRPAAMATNNKVAGMGVGAMGVPRTAWVVPPSNPKGKNTCDACRRRNEANRLAQMQKELQTQASQSVETALGQAAQGVEVVKSEGEDAQPTQGVEAAPCIAAIKDEPQGMQPPPCVQTAQDAAQEVQSTPCDQAAQEFKCVQPAQDVPKQEKDKSEAPQSSPIKVEAKDPPAAPPSVPAPPVKPRKPKPVVTKRGRKANNSKKKRQGKCMSASDKVSSAPQRPHKCLLCPFSFRSTSELKRHSSTHSGERPFLCELCGAGFVRKCHLQLHVRRHSGERRHVCQECRMRFFTPSDLARHQAIHQEGDKPLECHLCHLTFRRAFHLERHIRRHNDTAPFACKHCGAFFSSAAALRSHDKHHRTPGPHACPDCTAAFTTATALSRHRRVHSARHLRLLRAVDRHATANSSYECVSSEGSPLSLVIRKVAATTGGSGELGASPAKDSAGLPSYQAHREKEEGRKAWLSTLSASKKMEEDEEKASSHSVMAAESEEGSENVNKERDRQSTLNPSMIEKTLQDNTVKAKDESEKLNSIPSTIDTVNKDSENLSSTSLTAKEEEKELIREMSNDGKVKGKVDTTARSSMLAKDTRCGSLQEDTTAVEEDPYDFKLTAAERQAEIKSGAIKSNTKRHKKSHDFISKTISSLYSTDRKGEHIEPRGNKAVNKEIEHPSKSGYMTACDSIKRGGNAATEEKETESGCGLPAATKEGKEAKIGDVCSLLSPAGREAEAVKEIHCRTTYHLTVPSGGPGHAAAGGPGCPSKQQDSRSTSQDSGGQSSSVREGVATSS